MARGYTESVDEVLTWEEIERRFDGEWVVLDEPEVTDQLDIVRGRLVYHGDDKEEAEDTVHERGLRDYAIMFLGDPIPPGTIAIL